GPDLRDLVERTGPWNAVVQKHHGLPLLVVQAAADPRHPERAFPDLGLEQIGRGNPVGGVGRARFVAATTTGRAGAAHHAAAHHAAASRCRLVAAATRGGAHARATGCRSFHTGGRAASGHHAAATAGLEVLRAATDAVPAEVAAHAGRTATTDRGRSASGTATTDALGNSCAASAADALTDTSTRTAVGPESGLAQARRPLLISGVEDRPRGRALLTGLGGRGDLLGVLAVVVRQVPVSLSAVLLFLLALFPLPLRHVLPPLVRLALVEQLFAVLLQLLLVLLDGLVVAQDLRDRLALAVVDGHHRDAVRTVGLLGDDLHVAVLDPDLAVLARRVDLTVRPHAAGHVLPGPLRTERTTGGAADRFPLGLRAFLGNVFRVLVRVEVQVV